MPIPFGIFLRCQHVHRQGQAILVAIDDIFDGREGTVLAPRPHERPASKNRIDNQATS